MTDEHAQSTRHHAGHDADKREQRGMHRDADERVHGRMSVVELRGLAVRSDRRERSAVDVRSHMRRGRSRHAVRRTLAVLARLAVRHTLALPARLGVLRLVMVRRAVGMIMVGVMAMAEHVVAHLAVATVEGDPEFTHAAHHDRAKLAEEDRAVALVLVWGRCLQLSAGEGEAAIPHLQDRALDLVQATDGFVLDRDDLEAEIDQLHALGAVCCLHLLLHDGHVTKPERLVAILILGRRKLLQRHVRLDLIGTERPAPEVPTSRVHRQVVDLELIGLVGADLDVDDLFDAGNHQPRAFLVDGASVMERTNEFGTSSTQRMPSSASGSGFANGHPLHSTLIIRLPKPGLSTAES